MMKTVTTFSLKDLSVNNVQSLTNATYPNMFLCNRDVLCVLDLTHLNEEYSTLVMLKDGQLFTIQETVQKVMARWIKEVKQFHHFITFDYFLSSRQYKQPLTRGNLSFAPFTTPYSSNNWLALHHIKEITRYNKETVILTDNHLSLILDTNFHTLKRHLQTAREHSRLQHEILYECLAFFIEETTLNHYDDYFFKRGHLNHPNYLKTIIDNHIHKFLSTINEEDLISDKEINFMKRMNRQRQLEK
ncbi:competence protein ComK [Aerococcus suis]|uniref:ComK protein n=1 Tax=Aerococcus suis TaxID=371602 RepID=A0A1W1Y3X1_9LACT|nr:competence protein ComK [Aerococcus suis]MCI7240880.1 competence protein ComK [Aerococcus suis]MDD7758297.1 competence protein ComK [Aerococcus suis]MDY4647251.1 competence protein ComK [Aerococcus suis]SMC30428.1 ComK protein [Aerococcus suis]